MPLLPSPLTASIEQNNAQTINYQPLPFTSAADFVEFFDPSLRSGQKHLHPWQRETLEFLSDADSLRQGKRPRFTIAEKLKFLLGAANGSGKDAFVIAGFVTFVLCCWQRYKIVVTSSSGLQLDTQTRTYIKNLCQEVNTYLRQNGILDEDAIDIKVATFKSKIFEKQDGSKYALTGGEIITFVTDEGGRAEGHHPWPDALPGEGVIIIINEGKSVPDEIYTHLGKCTYNIWVEVSSAGEASQHFYRAFSSARDWGSGWQPNTYYKRKITSYDCPHKPTSAIEADKLEYGEQSDFFRATHLTEFINSSGAVVITETALIKCLKTAKLKVDVGLPLRAGLDLAGGGDECALYVFDNNVFVGREVWRSRDTEFSVDLLAGIGNEPGVFSKFGLKPENIFGDDNGLGQPIIDGLARRGWDIVRVRNQSSAYNKTSYLNRGIELWARFARLVEECIVVLPPDDEKLHKELANRHYDTSEVQGKRKLLSKEEEKSQGHPSPNRADAVVLAFTGLTITDFQDGKRSIARTVPQNIPSQEILANISNGPKERTYDFAPAIESFRSEIQAELNKQKKVNKFGFSNPANLLRSIYD
jgi:hypothetical protein